MATEGAGEDLAAYVRTAGGSLFAQLVAMLASGGNGVGIFCAAVDANAVGVNMAQSAAGGIAANRADWSLGAVGISKYVAADRGLCGSNGRIPGGIGGG